MKIVVMSIDLEGVGVKIISGRYRTHSLLITLLPVSIRFM